MLRGSYSFEYLGLERISGVSLNESLFSGMNGARRMNCSSHEFPQAE